MLACCTHSTLALIKNLGTIVLVRGKRRIGSDKGATVQQHCRYRRQTCQEGQSHLNLGIEWDENEGKGVRRK